MSSPLRRSRRAWITTVAIVVVVALIAVAAVAYLANRPQGPKYSAMMSTVIGLYPGADVRILGVPVGTVDTVTPEGQLVRVDFHVRDDVKVPAGAFAAVVAPTVVADRYLQLAPAYGGGPTLAEGSIIPKERTASPAEFDDLVAATQKLSTALGPQGANQTGAVSQALTTATKNLQGNGQQINKTLDNTAQAITTLSASRENLAGTIQNLQSFTSNLKDNDGQVRAFTEQFAEINGFLADERKNLGETLKELSETLDDVARFVRDNRDDLRSNVDKLAEILGTVNAERLALEQVLDTAGLGLDGLVNAYNAASGTLDTRPAILDVLFCSLFGIINQNPLLAPVAQLLGPILNEFLAPLGGLGRCLEIGGGEAASGLTPDAVAKLSQPKVPLMFGPKGTAAAPAGLPAAGAPAAGAPGGQALSDKPADRPASQPPAHRPGAPTTLDSLLGGGR